MAYDNRSVSPLKIKGSPLKKDGPKKGENYTQYAKRTMAAAEFQAWNAKLDGPKSHRRTKVWDGNKWISKSEWEKLTSGGKTAGKKTGETGKEMKKPAKKTEGQGWGWLREIPGNTKED